MLNGLMKTSEIISEIKKEKRREQKEETGISKL